MFGSFTLRFSNFCQKFELVLGIVNHVLFYPTVNHSIQWSQEIVVKSGGFLENLVSTSIVA